LSEFGLVGFADCGILSEMKFGGANQDLRDERIRRIMERLKSLQRLFSPWGEMPSGNEGIKQTCEAPISPCNTIKIDLCSLK